MNPNRSNRWIHRGRFKAQILAACRQPGALVSVVSIAHGLNSNVVRKWFTGHGLKRMGRGIVGGHGRVAVPDSLP